MATYLIEGTVTAWPAGTVYLEAAVASETFSDSSTMVDLNTGQYSIQVSADPGEKVWVRFYGATFDMYSGPPGNDDRVAVQTIFGPFIIDDIGVLQ